MRNRPAHPWEGNPELSEQYGEALDLLEQINNAIFDLSRESRQDEPAAEASRLCERRWRPLGVSWRPKRRSCRRRLGNCRPKGSNRAAMAAPAHAQQASGGRHLLKSMRLPAAFKGRDDWERFAFQAESYLAVVDTRHPLELEVARKTKTPLQMADMTEDVRTMSVRLFGMLGSWTQDSATAVKLARGVKGQNGFELWRLLWVEHTPENESKALSWRRALLTPRFPPREQEFSLALQEWEADIDRYASEYGEGRAIADEDMRAVVLVTESPSALRQHLAMHASTLSTYAEVREVVVSYLQAKRVWTPSAGYAASSRKDPNAMDIGKVGDGKGGKGKADKGKGKGDRDHKGGKGDHKEKEKKGNQKGGQHSTKDAKERGPICWRSKTAGTTPRERAKATRATWPRWPRTRPPRCPQPPWRQRAPPRPKLRAPVTLAAKARCARCVTTAS